VTPRRKRGRERKGGEHSDTSLSLLLPVLLPLSLPLPFREEMKIKNLALGI
jgi:hypothetical protein